MSVSKRLRYEILRRDGHTCRYCGASAPEARLTVDHVIPVAIGGEDTPDNLVCACVDCNAGKSSIPADAPVVEDAKREAFRWAAAFAAAMDDELYAAEKRRSELETFDQAWRRWTYDDGTPVSRPGDWGVSVGRWLEIGTPIEILVALIDDVVPSSRISDDRMWTYYCGAVWRVIRRAQDNAEGFIDRGFDV